MKIAKKDIEDDFLTLARIALAGRVQDIQLLIHKASKKYKEEYPELTNGLVNLLQEAPTRASPLRKQSDIPLPVDVDTRLQLLRLDHQHIEHEPILNDSIKKSLQQVLSERNYSKALYTLGLQPTKSLLFTGPPGVGKTLAAKWIASQLKRPLLVLDLAAVMSSYLGRTGNNIRFVLDYAKSIDCVLLLDELDAIAKRRDDNSEIGELKRLVTVLLQEIDDWPSSGLLIAATNHPDLLDPAVWRRFEVVLEFSLPTRLQIKELVSELLNGHIKDSSLWGDILSFVFLGKSFSDIEKEILYLRRASVIEERPFQEIIEAKIKMNTSLNRSEKVELACVLIDSKIMSQRRAHELTGIARETIRKKNVNRKNTKIKAK